MITTVSLKGAEFFAHHGYYPEEQVLGATFIVDIDVSFQPLTDDGNDELDNTVNYEQLYHICCEVMKTPRKLIETVATDILNGIKTRYKFAEEVVVVVKKKHPPFKSNINYSAVTIRYTQP